MAQNPLLGNKISLISKKNIRYEGTLYSINEANATVALQNVKSYGTEGREKLDPETLFVAPQDSIHAYLLFRGCDIKDLHVHEQVKTTDETRAVPPTVEEQKPTAKPVPSKTPGRPTPIETSTTLTTETPLATATKQHTVVVAEAASTTNLKGKGKENRNGSSRANPAVAAKNASSSNNNRRSGAQVGTGASLLNRKARGSVQGGPGPEFIEGEFDFQAKLEEFERNPNSVEDYEEAGDEVADGNSYYDKDDFFDSISCDALDKQMGIDNRLRGKQERELNTETFGAVALNSDRRRRGRGGGGRGCYGGGRGGGGRNGGAGPGRGRGRGRGRGGRGRNNNNWADRSNNGGSRAPVQPSVAS